MGSEGIEPTHHVLIVANFTSSSTLDRNSITGSLPRPPRQSGSVQFLSVLSFEEIHDDLLRCGTLDERTYLHEEKCQTMPRGKTYDDALAAIGDTPMIRINRLVPQEHATVFAKCEFFQPLNSVKDRIGVAMIEAAERDGLIGPDTHIVEPTSGNTGIALAFVCAARGYKLTLTMPESMSIERRALLLSMGADLELTPAAEGMPGAIRRATEMVEGGSDVWMPQQFENPANPAIHEATTGPEIWEDSGHDIDAIVAGVGTGGTITGVARYLKSKNPTFQGDRRRAGAFARHQRRKTGQTSHSRHRRRLHPEEPGHVPGGRRRSGRRRSRLRMGSQTGPERRHRGGYQQRGQHVGRRSSRGAARIPWQTDRHHHVQPGRTLFVHAAVWKSRTLRRGWHWPAFRISLHTCVGCPSWHVPSRSHG